MLIKRRYINRVLAVAICVVVAGRLSAQSTTPQSDTINLSKATKEKGVQITGIITDGATHKPLAGIRVQVADYSAAITDSLGQFALRVPSYSAAVIVEGEGRETRRVALKGRNTINVALLDDENESFHETITMP